MAQMRRISHVAVLGVIAALLATPALAAARTPRTAHGSFPIDDHFVIEPESTTCGFPITLDLTGTGSFSALLDDQGLNEKVHIHIRESGTLSANGIVLPAASVDNLFTDFFTLTERETGIAFRASFLGGGVVIMDRGRLVWNFDPNIQDTVGDPIFVAGPHPDLEGDIAGLCAALTPTP
jgi:hypothetical protein